MSLLSDIQQLTERTYRPTGVNFEHFLIGRQRCRVLSQLASNHRELPDVARVFLRVQDHSLVIAIYYADDLIRTLEANDPRRGLTEKNILAFIVFVEELNHAVHAALKFLEGTNNIATETFVRDLELQARIDSYLLLKFFLASLNASGQLENMDRLWLRHHLFERAEAPYESPLLAARYGEVNQLAEKYTRFIDSLRRHERLEELRRFRAFPYGLKKQQIALLP